MDEGHLQETLMNVLLTLFDARKEIAEDRDVCSLADMTIDMVDEIEEIAGVAPLKQDGNTARLSVVTNNGSRFHISIVQTR